MKRKLNHDDVPETPEPSASPVPSPPPPPPQSKPGKRDSHKPSSKRKSSDLRELDSALPTFDSFGLDKRLLRAIRDQKWSTPTPAQVKAIPLALEGKHIFLRSRTGSGKSAAVCLPVIHNILRQQRQALILVPTKELALQIEKLAKSLGAYCGIRVLNIAGSGLDVAQRAKLAINPDVVVGTPARIKARIQDGSLLLDRLAGLVIDEADLVLGYGMQGDMEEISKSIPKGVQILLMSATLNTELENLSCLFCDDPMRLDIQDSEEDSQLVAQYTIKTSEEEKFLLLMAFFLLKLIKGKTIVFVGDIDRSYRVKLFLEQFGIKSCVLNSELPLASRLHIVEELNKGHYDILIASDEAELLGTRERKTESRRQKRAKTEDDSGVARGIDFLGVQYIINFDMPLTQKSYFHRIGRTARAGKSGTAISFVIPKENFKKHKPTTFIGAENDELVLERVIQKLPENQKIEDYTFDMKKLVPFRYRFGDALRAVTRIAVREARLKELRSELLQSQKLSRYFEENPEMREHLQHDLKLTHPARIQPHLKHVPDYLLPGGKGAENVGFASLGKEKWDKPRITRRKNRVVRMKSGRLDPLKTFNKRGRGKK